jgi:hypothetical protein
MRNSEVFEELVKIIGAKIRSYEFMLSSRRSPKFFSKKGKIGFVNLFSFMLNFVKKSVQVELDLFAEMVDGMEQVSKQAFSEARQKISFEAFQEIFQDTVRIASQGNNMATFKGLRTYAVDGTSLAIENSAELVEYFGCSGRGTTSATARVSTLYDVLNEYIVDGCIEKFSCGERELAFRHIETICEREASKTLIIFDRGYACAELISKLADSGIHFLMRVRRKFNRVIDDLGLGEGFAEITYQGKSYPVRVVKFLLKSGEVETLITDLEASFAPLNEMQDLYFKRWRIETKYGVGKINLQLENFTGKTVITVLQDFYATMFLLNMVSFAKLKTDEEIDAVKEDKEDLKHKYVTNINVMIGKMKDKLILIMLESNPEKRQRMFAELCKGIAKNKVPVRPGRTSERKLPRKKRYKMNKKHLL